MKKYILDILACGLIMLSIGCHPSTTSEKITIQFNLNKGQTFQQLTKTTRKIHYDILGVGTTIRQEYETYFLNEVLDVSTTGVITIKATYQRIRLAEENSLRGKQVFDTQNSTSSGQADQVATKLIGKSIIYKMDNAGTLIDVSMADSLFDDIYGLSGGSEQSDAQKTRDHNKADFKKMMEQMLAHLPRVPVSLGDTWKNRSRWGGGMPIRVNETYTLESVDPETITITVSGDVMRDEGADVKGSSLVADLTGRETGTIILDRNSGLTQKMEIRHDLNGHVNVMGLSVPATVEEVFERRPF